MFDLTKYTKVYAPTLSNSPIEIEILDKEKFYPIKLSENRMSLTKDGKHSTHAPNPVVFPYTQEWYDKIKSIYPDLEPYVVDYRAVIKNILANCDVVVCKMSYDSFDNAIASNAVFATHRNTILNDSIYYVPVNPYTLKPCNSDMDYYVLPDLYIPF